MDNKIYSNRKQKQLLMYQQEYQNLFHKEEDG